MHVYNAVLVLKEIIEVFPIASVNDVVGSSIDLEIQQLVQNEERGDLRHASTRALLPPATTEDAAQDGDQGPLIAIISTANTGDPSLPDRARARQTCLAAICAYIRPAKSNMAHCRPLR